MSSRKKNKGKNNKQQSRQKPIVEQLVELETKQDQLLAKALQSNDPETLLKANMLFTKNSNSNQIQVSDRKSLLLDPFQLYDTLGFKDKAHTVTYDTLRNMAKSPVIKSIVETRIEQVASYSQVQSENRKAGWMIRRKNHSHTDYTDRQAEIDRRIIDNITEFLLNGGSIGDNWNSDDFEVFLRKTTRDSLVLDQMTYEIVRDRKGLPVEYFATDGSTYRLSDSLAAADIERVIIKNKINYYPKYVQYIQGTIYEQFYPWELCFGIRNHNTKLLTSGYGRSELEDMIRIVTWMLYSDQYNGNFFCIHKDSLITTDLGIFPIKELEGREFKIWNGLSFEKAKAFKTETKDIVRTKLKNGIELKTSPDHRFFIIPKDSTNGEIKEVKQKDLREGDFCILDNKIYESDFDYNSLGIDEVDSKLDIIPNIILKKLSKLELKSKTGNRKIKLDIEGLLKYNNIPRTKIIDIFNTNNIEIPDILKYSYCPIDTLDKEKIGEDIMYEIEVFDNKHLYFANFIAVHNSQGAAPKGIIRLQGNVNSDRLAEFKQQWKAQIAGVQNCLHGDTVIYTKEFGGKSLKEIVGDKEETPTTIWTGEEWCTGLVYKTKEKKQLTEIITENGSIKCSPDHKFMILNDNGEQEWKKQSELNIGDYILTSKQPIENKDQDKIKYNNKVVNSDLFEVLGWIIGDGCITYNKSKSLIRLFFHQEKEVEIFNRYYDILLDYGINCYQSTTIVTEEEQEKIKQKYGFKSCASKRICIYIPDIKFVKWYLDLGFKKSSEGKEIPSFLYTYYSNEKCAFLKGFFSADGNCAKGRYPQISISNPILREQTRYLLSTEGIKCNYKIQASACRFQNGIKKERTLCVKDYTLFFEKVGFIQEHKQLKAKVLKENEINKSQNVNQGAVKKFLRIIKDIDKEKSNEDRILSFREKSDINNILCGKDKCSLTKLLRIADKVNYKLPYYFYNYSFIAIKDLKVYDDFIDMYDVSINNEKHAFVLNINVLNHNSWKTPVLEADKMDFINLQMSNADMQFGQWQEYLIRLTCAMYKIDPVEIGFLQGSGGNSQSMFEASQQVRIKYSQERGLIPILKFIQSKINKYLVSQLNNDFEFIFTGLENEDEKAELQADIQKLGNFMSLKEIRRKRGLPEEVEKGDMIFNPIYFQLKMQEQQSDMGDMMGDNEDINYDETLPENDEDNPFLKSFNGFVDKLVHEDK